MHRTWSAAWRPLTTAAAELALDRTLTCGQSFSWTRLANGWWCNVLGSGPTALPVVLRESEGGALEYQSFTHAAKDPSPPTVLSDYFQLHHSAAVLYSDWSARDPHFAAVAQTVPGIRLMRQPPVENLFSFICSSNNNIPRITAMVQHLRRRGDVAFPGGVLDGVEVPEMHAFPSPETLAADDGLESALRELGFGYRAKYIAQSASMLAERGGEKWLLGLRDLEYDAARTALLELPGIGPKVADCILLMSLDKPRTIPVDTHVWQIATTDYKLKSNIRTKTLTPAAYREVVALFQQLFGDQAGWAHSVLFTAHLAKPAAKAKRKKAASDTEAESSASITLSSLALSLVLLLLKIFVELSVLNIKTPARSGTTTRAGGGHGASRRLIAKFGLALGDDRSNNANTDIKAKVRSRSRLTKIIILDKTIILDKNLVIDKSRIGKRIIGKFIPSKSIFLDKFIFLATSAVWPSSSSSSAVLVCAVPWLLVGSLAGAPRHHHRRIAIMLRTSLASLALGPATV
ncbi:8-oxoguanine glycosylase ogg1 [Blastocladiella emersonii ATCC 22665]|nr:8-oxoguanine glycosylase ogg1 [Blastocladiella emersonii ATCC 22665]